MEVSRDTLERETLSDLRALCRTRRLRGYSTLNKAELIDFILREQERASLKRSWRSVLRSMRLLFCPHGTAPVEQRDQHPRGTDSVEDMADFQCVVCMINRRIIGGECGHVPMCNRCSLCTWQREKICPICRAPWCGLRIMYL